MSGSNDNLHLDTHLELDMLPGLVQRIREPLTQGSPLVLDGSAVQSVDGAAVQLLLAAVRAAKQENIPCKWRQPSSSLRKAAALLGLTDELLLEVSGQ